MMSEISIEQAEFLLAVRGKKGEIDAWLEVNNEAECRAAILALIAQIEQLTQERDDARLAAKMHLRTVECQGACLHGAAEGYVLVPIAPTEDMVIAGFESRPEWGFVPGEEMEKYEAMSGCQQAAHRARLCYAAMLAAAPTPVSTSPDQ